MNPLPGPNNSVFFFFSTCGWLMLANFVDNLVCLQLTFAGPWLQLLLNPPETRCGDTETNLMPPPQVVNDKTRKPATKKSGK